MLFMNVESATKRYGFLLLAAALPTLNLGMAPTKKPAGKPEAKCQIDSSFFEGHPQAALESAQELHDRGRLRFNDALHGQLSNSIPDRNGDFILTVTVSIVYASGARRFPIATVGQLTLF